MIFVLYFSLILSGFDVLFTEEKSSVIKPYNLSEIFSSRIVFNDLCEDRTFSSWGSQTVTSNPDLSRYHHYERVYSKSGNDVSIKFHFEGERLLYASVWEKYLINDVLVPSENMVIDMSVNYYGVEYTNVKWVRRFPLEASLTSDIEMSRINYTVLHPDSCQHKTLIEIEAYFNGIIYNKDATRSISLDNVKFVFQVAPRDTIQHEVPEGAIVYKPQPRFQDPVAEFIHLAESFEGSYAEKWHEMDCAMWKGKPYMCRSSSRMLFRLPEPHYSEILNLEGCRYFNPLGLDKPMKNWVQVHAAYRDDKERLAVLAEEFVKQ